MLFKEGLLLVVLGEHTCSVCVLQEEELDSTTLEGRYLLSASVIAPSLSRVQTATSGMAGIQQQCVKFLQVRC